MGRERFAKEASCNSELNMRDLGQLINRPELRPDCG